MNERPQGWMVYNLMFEPQPAVALSLSQMVRSLRACLFVTALFLHWRGLPEIMYMREICNMHKNNNVQEQATEILHARTHTHTTHMRIT